jgi:hypothetical protein
VKVPASPPDTLVIEPHLHVRKFQAPLWRIFRTEGDHALAWNELRHYGPVDEMRFDPHPLPPAVHPDHSVMYAATQPHTALGEVYQEERLIQRAAGGATLVSWTPSRELELLDLTSNWPVLNGAAAAMMMDDKQHTQAWAHAIDEAFGLSLDGLYHQSSINNEPLVTLFHRVEVVEAFPARPTFRTLLSDAAADEIIRKAKKLLGYESA